MYNQIKSNQIFFLQTHVKTNKNAQKCKLMPILYKKNVAKYSQYDFINAVHISKKKL